MNIDIHYFIIYELLYKIGSGVTRFLGAHGIKSPAASDVLKYNSSLILVKK